MSGNRVSENAELSAINNILEVLKSKPDTRCSFFELTVIHKNDRQTFPEISMAFNNLRKQDFMGTQYEWLACFATTHPGVELSIHKDDKAAAMINKHGGVKKAKDPVTGDYFVIDETISEKDIVTLFGNYRFPLFGYTKKMMRKEYKKINCPDIIDLTWFCFTPIDGKPCGQCNPCKYTIEEGLSWRFSPEALKRYRERKRKDNPGLLAKYQMRLSRYFKKTNKS